MPDLAVVSLVLQMKNLAEGVKNIEPARLLAPDCG
jgi:hypothetical protein